MCPGKPEYLKSGLIAHLILPAWHQQEITKEKKTSRMSSYCYGGCHTTPVIILGHLHMALVLLCSCIRKFSAGEHVVVFVCFVCQSIIKIFHNDF